MKAHQANFYFTIFILLCGLIAIAGCKHDEPLIKSVVSIQSAENVTTTTATLVALVTPNQESTNITFEYRPTADPIWKSQVMTEKLSGSVAIKVTAELKDLVPNTQYAYRAKALNAAGEVISSTITFTTGVLAQATAATYPAESITLTTAKVRATIYPNQANTNVSLEYRVIGVSTWSNQAWTSSLSGTSPVEVNFELSTLVAGSKYEYRVKAINLAGEVVSPNASFETYAVADYDGNLYHSVTIGTQTWLKENFRGTHYANGDPIPNVTNPDTWSTLTTGAYCYYNNDPEIGKVYGGLYNWWVGADARGLIIGWHFSREDEWSIIAGYLGAYLPAGLAMMEAGNSHWNSTKYPATNSSGFTALPNGAFALDAATNKFIFMNLNEAATFWTPASYGTNGDAVIIASSNCGLSGGLLYNKNYGFGIRLVKN